MYKLKESTLYSKSGKITPYISYSLSTLHHKLCLRVAIGVPRFWNINQWHHVEHTVAMIMQNATTKGSFKPINSNGHLRQFFSVSKYMCNRT